MKGIVKFSDDSYVAKQSEFIKQEFLNLVNEMYNKNFSESDIEIANVRYYPRGTEDSQFEFGSGVGIYQYCEGKRGSFKVWTIK